LVGSCWSMPTPRLVWAAGSVAREAEGRVKARRAMT
jgi:hypothetical protein